MDWSSKCAAVIPCLNEAASVASVVAAVRRHLSTVLVVDDGSGDATARTARAAGAEVLRHPKTRGKGAALATGWRHAEQLGFEWVATLDGDGQHSADDLPALLAVAGPGDVDLVVGNRMNDPARMPWLRRRVNRWMSRRLSAAAGVWLPDSQCGFRLMRLAAWSGLELKTAHFEVESEILLEFASRGFKLAFVHVQTIYKAGPSKIHPLRDTVRWFRWWLGARRKSP